VLELFLSYFVVLFVVVDPIGVAAIFFALTHGETRAHQTGVALRGTLIAAGVLVLFALFGDALLSGLGIGMPAFQIAGGILLLLLAVEMVFARHSGLRAPTVAEQKEAERRKEISVFPLAVPLIAGPGALTSVLLMVGEQNKEPVVIGTVLVALAAVLLLTLFALLLSARIMAVLGETGANVVSRVLGIVLAALAVQFVIDGAISAAYGLLDEEAGQVITI
jgi:multiple antibiotic resistance protein